MALISNRYGKGRVRTMRIHKDGARHEVRELTVKAMVEGDFGKAYTNADNSTCLSTDTVKDVINVVARENLDLSNELFCKAVSDRFLEAYPLVEQVTVVGSETKWTRLVIDGEEHAHAFTLDGNGMPFAKTVAKRGAGLVTTSGIEGYTFMKTTQSGWANYAKDPYTTIKETTDRMCATAMAASWDWSGVPADYPATNKAILDIMLKVFATTSSSSVQDSLYRMGMAALAAVPELKTISMACPNKHYLLMNLTPFGLENDNQVFLPTDEPHGQIECTVGRD